MRWAGNLHPEWGHAASVPNRMRNTRIALVATAIGAIGGAAVVVSLIDEPGSGVANTSIAAHALITRTPVIPTPAPPPKVVANTQSNAHPRHEAASAGLLAPAGASATATGAIANTFQHNLTMSPASAPAPTRPAASAPIPTNAEATAASGVARTDAAQAIAPMKESSTKKHRLAARRRHHRLFDEFGGRGCCTWRHDRFGVTRDEW
jgi:hypothetical protein